MLVFFMSKLFSKLTIRGVTFPNRIVLSPLCMYSAKEGMPNEWHFSHLSTFARAKIGCIFAEATAVQKEGRITPFCLGLWNDEQMHAFKPIVSFIKYRIFRMERVDEHLGCPSWPNCDLAPLGCRLEMGTDVEWYGYKDPIDQEEKK